MNRYRAEELMVEYSRRLHQNGWVANHDGNITLKLGDDRFLATPTAVSKGAVTRDMLIAVNGRGEVVSGRYKGFSELALHLYVYRNRPDVMAVIHAHPPTATGLSVAGVPVLSSMMAEPVVSLGAVVPLVAYACPKSAQWTSNLSPAIDDSDVVTLENHGALSFGSDLETAYLRMELVEHLAKIQIVAHQAGGIREIPIEDQEVLLQARSKAGLGKAARERVVETR